MTMGTLEDVTGLKRKVQELLRDVRTLKDENGALKLQLQAAKPGGLDAPPDDETPRDKWLREQAEKMRQSKPDLKPGTPEFQAEIDAILNSEEGKAFLDAEVKQRVTEFETKLTSLNTAVEKAHLRQAATRLATTLAKTGHAELLLPHIMPRLAVKWDGDECSVTVKDADGREISEEALLGEFREFRPDLAAVVQGATEADKLAHARRVAETLGPAKTIGASRQYTRTEFDALEPAARSNALANGAKVVDH